MTSQVLSEQLSTVPVQAFVRLLQGHAAATRVLSADLVREHGLTITTTRPAAPLAPTIDG